MAQVPYDPVPTGAPGPLPTEGPRVDAPGAAFGTNIGEALQRSGAQVGQAGNELFQTALQIQQLKNETNARENAISAGQDMAIAQKDYELRPDKFETGVMMAHLKNLNDIRQKYRGNLNPMAARFYDNEAATLQNRFTGYSTILAGRALQQRSVDTAKAKIELNRRGSVNVWDDKEVEDKLASDEESLRTLATSSEVPWSPERLEAERVKERQALRLAQLKGQGDQDINRAFATFDKVVKNKELDPEQENAAREMLWERNRTQNGLKLAMDIYSKDKTIDKMDQDFKDNVEKYSHGDPKFEGAAWQTYKSITSNERWTEQQEINRAEQTLMKVVHKGTYATQAQAEADPNDGPTVKAALATVAGTKFDFPGQLNAYNQQKGKVGREENYNNLLGMATSQDPQKRQEFLKANLFAQGLNDGQLGRLLAKRESMIGGQHGLDPQVRAAYTNLVQQYGDAIPKPNAGNRYTEFLGLIHSDLEEWQREEKPLPTTIEDYKKFGQGIMGRQPGTGWSMFGDIGQKEIYRTPVPKDFQAFYRQQGWDDRAISIRYHTMLAVQRYNELFSGGEGGGQ